MKQNGEVQMQVEPPLQKRKIKEEERLAYTVEETASLLGISPKSVLRLIHRGLLRPSRGIRHHVIAKKEIERYLAETQ